MHFAIALSLAQKNLPEVYTTRKEVLPMETHSQVAKGVFLVPQFAVFYPWTKHGSYEDHKISPEPVERVETPVAHPLLAAAFA